MTTLDFYCSVYNHLNPNGAVLLNYFGKTDEKFEEIKENIGQMFSDLQVHQVTPINPEGENYILVGVK